MADGALDHISIIFEQEAGKVPGAWCCSLAHLLGMVIRDKGEHYTRLLLTRRAFLSEETVPSNAFFAKVDSAEVVCSICGEKKVWRLGDDYIRRLRRKR